ncbi:EAL domain-containing protein [Dehalobacter sp. DCM]|uniref:bifunctional diguanylate cyclase/phosphodiesterase n=1 Tax=Dehalobacter sp. DCM TaxID=2907827 RepID=UPI0030819B8D|nr:EAL domain-containing protein [Dehalobacter sp. DCM]
MKSIRIKIIIIFVLIFTISLSILAGLNYWQSRNVILKNIKNELVKTADSQAEIIKMWFDIRKAEVGTIARSPVLLNGNREAGLTYLRSEWKNNPLFENILWADPDGHFFGADGIVAKVSTLEDFNRVLSGETIIQGPLISPSTGKLVVSVVAPIVNNGKVTGEIAIPVTVRDIEQHILSVKVGQSGYAFIVRSDGLTVIHPDIHVANRENCLTDPDSSESFKEAVRKMARGEKGFGNYVYKGIERYIAYAPVPGTDMSIAITVPLQEVNNNLVSFTKISMCIIIGVLILVVLILVHVTLFIVRPIEVLEKEANRVAGGDLSVTTVNVHSKDEVGSLARAFENMVQKLNESYSKLALAYNKLEVTYEQISASEEELRQQYDELQKSEEELLYLAHYDQLTNLPNRTLLFEQVSSYIAKADQNQKKAVLFYLDLDNFKSVNDTLGHIHGDLLLMEVGKRLSSCVKKADTVARLGGDEFGILLRNIDNNIQILSILERISADFREPFVLNGYEFFITASIGIVIYPEHGENVDTLLKNADTAMYHAKNSGKNGFRFYENSMNQSLLDWVDIENKLRRAIEKNELVLFYQPQIDLISGKIKGFEALIRWYHPKKGLIKLTEFITVAEETGLIIPIGEWALHTACHQLKGWHDMGHEHLNISINLSARQFKQPNFTETIEKILSETRVSPSNIELEITESTAIENINNTIHVLHRLKHYGIRIALDDFGKGYSSLNYLKELPIDIIKLDKDFVFDILEDNKQKLIAKTIITLAHGMGLEVVAEGIETREILIFLKDIQCNSAQGFLFSKPLIHEEAELLLTKQSFL